MKKKALLVVLAALVLVAGSIGATLAWLTDTSETLTNTFTVGNVTITLEEEAWDEAGYGPSNPAVIVPGVTIPKDPTITVDAGSEDCWVYASVAIPPEIEAVMEDLDLGAGWAYDPTQDIYYYASTVDDTSMIPAVFEEVVISGDTSNDQIKAIYDAPDNTIDIIAYAIQATAGETAMLAWTEAGL